MSIWTCFISATWRRTRSVCGNALPFLTSQHEVPDEPKEVIELFKDFTAASSDEKIARWQRIKEEQKQYLATWKHESKSKKLEAQGRPEQAGGSSKRVPTPPPPPAKPGLSLRGSTSKAAPSQKHWIEDLQDNRKIGQGPHLLRTKSEAERGRPQWCIVFYYRATIGP